MKHHQQDNEQPRPFYFNVVEEHGKEVVLEVSQEDYERDLASGLAEDELLKPGRHTFRRVSPERFAKWHSQPHQITVYVNVPLDHGVFKYFEKRAAEANVESIEKFIGDTLRAVMEAEMKDKSEDELRGFEKLVDDERFITAVAERVQKRIRI